jgi:hypothetical protein
VLMENRNGLIVDAMVTEADGSAERDAAMLIGWRKFSLATSMIAPSAWTFWR